MIPSSYIKAIGMILLAVGGFSSARIAVYFDEPFVALGYLLSGLVIFGAGIRQAFAGRP